MSDEFFKLCSNFRKNEDLGFYIELNSFFIKNAAERVVELLIGSQEQAKLSEKFSWKKALGQEKLVHNMLKNNA